MLILYTLPFLGQKRENPYAPKLPLWGIKGFMGLENNPSPFMHSP